MGHGSQFINATAVEKLVKILNKAYQFRKEQENALHYTHDGCKHSQAKTLGDVTSLNCTFIKAGDSEVNSFIYLNIRTANTVSM